MNTVCACVCDISDILHVCNSVCTYICIHYSVTCRCCISMKGLYIDPIALSPGPFPVFQCCTLKCFSFSMLHAENISVCNIEKLRMGLGMRLYMYRSYFSDVIFF